MADLLFELLSEEIPAGMQNKAIQQLEEKATKLFTEASLRFESLKGYVTPRRLTLHVQGLPLAQDDRVEEKRGPREGAPDQALQGFLKGSGLSSLDEAELRDTGKGQFYFAVSHTKGQQTKVLLSSLLAELVTSFSWPKSQRWGRSTFRWVRPLRSVVAVFDGEVVSGQIDLSETESLPFSNKTQGHRFLSEGTIQVQNFQDYEQKLSQAFVVLDQKKRLAEITLKARDIAEAEGLSVREDLGLLEEVAALVEWPVPILGYFDKSFMSVPTEALVLSMREHQKYFALETEKGQLANAFITFANLQANDGGLAIRQGNERVLKARLSDAQFFWEEDQKKPLESHVEKLKSIVFHAKIGTLADKTAAVGDLAAHLAKTCQWTQEAQGKKVSEQQVRRAALLSKADLVTSMVYEFPELQGKMGYYYALQQGEDQAVALAIRDHYSPLGPTSSCPKEPVSVALALADKLYTLASFWVIDEKPTGSKDPYGLRRSALGVIRLLVENKVRLDLDSVLKMLFVTLGQTVSSENQAKDFSNDKAVEDLLSFIKGRFEVLLKNKGHHHSVVQAVLDSGGSDFYALSVKVDALSAFLKSEEGQKLEQAYRRASGIVSQQLKDGQTIGSVQESLLVEPAEKDLYKALLSEEEKVHKALEDQNYAQAMQVLIGLPLETFFESVHVMAEDASLRQNRVALLARLKAPFLKIANFDCLEG